MFNGISQEPHIIHNLNNTPLFEKKNSINIPIDEENESTNSTISENTLETNDKKITDLASGILPVSQNESNPISYDRLTFGSRISSKISKLFNKIKSILVLQLIVKPAINKWISSQLKNIEPKNYQENYKKFTLSSNELFKLLRSKHKSVSLFSDKILSKMFEKRLIIDTNRVLNKNKLPNISKEKMQKASYERKLIFLIDNPIISSDLAQELSVIPSHIMPIDLLAKLELNDQNKDVLLSTWKRVINDLPVIGSLDILDSPYLKDKTSLRVDCALKLLEAIKFAPKSLDTQLDKLLNKISNEEFQMNLIDFIVHENSMSSKPIDLKYSNLIQKQKIYLETIMPALEKLLKESMDSDDCYEVFNTLSDKDLNNGVKILYDSLDEYQKNIFSFKNLERILIKELETVAIEKFNFIPLQIEKLREKRRKCFETIKNKDNVETIIQQKINNFEKLNKRYQKFAIKRFDGEDVKEQENAQKIFTQVVTEDVYKQLKLECPNPEVLLEISSGYKSRSEIGQSLIREVYKLMLNDILNSKLESINSSLDHDLLIKEIRLIALTKHKLKKIMTSEEDQKFINEKIDFFNKQITNSKALELLSCTFDEIDYPYRYEFLYGNSIVEQIKKSGYQHPSGISSEAIIELMNIDRISNLKINDCRIEDHQKKELMQALQKIVKIPGIAEILKKFEDPKKNKEKFRPTTGVAGLFNKLKEKIKPSKINELYKIPAGLTSETFTLVRDYLQMQEQHPEITKNLVKAQNLLEKYQLNPHSINNSERLSLHEIGSVFKFSEFTNTLMFFKELELENDPLIKDFDDLSQQSLDVKKKFESILLPAFSSHYASGDIFTYYGKRKLEWGAKALSPSDKLATVFCGGKTHVMKSFHKDGKLRGSEIAEDYENTKMRVYDVAISDAWRLNIAPLVSNATAEKLKEIFGENWIQILQKQYEGIEDKIHGVKSKKYKNINNSSLKQGKAGMADWKWFFSLIKPFYNLNIKGHTKKYKQDFNNIYNTFMSGEKVEQSQICSEFASKTTLVAIIKLNRDIAKQIAKKNPELLAANIYANLVEKSVKLPNNVVNYLKGIRMFGKEHSITKKAEQDLKKILKDQKYNKKEIDLIIRLNNKEIIDLPYDKRERMSTIHPARMISILEEKKCVTKLDKPKEFKDLIQI